VVVETARRRTFSTAAANEIVSAYGPGFEPVRVVFSSLPRPFRRIDVVGLSRSGIERISALVTGSLIGEDRVVETGHFRLEISKPVHLPFSLEQARRRHLPHRFAFRLRRRLSRRFSRISRKFRQVVDVVALERQRRFDGVIENVGQVLIRRLVGVVVVADAAVDGVRRALSLNVGDESFRRQHAGHFVHGGRRHDVVDFRDVGDAGIVLESMLSIFLFFVAIKKG
jgi:hypothetical protein